jgi:hypothetical protein
MEFKKYDHRFGALLDSLTVPLGRRMGVEMDSVYVRRLPRVTRARTVT